MSARKLLPVLSPILTVALALALGLPGHARAQAAPEDDGAITPPPVGESDAKGGGAGATDLGPFDDDSPRDGRPAGPGYAAPAGSRGVPGAALAPDSWIYQPRYAFQMSAFFATHPTDSYMGVLLAGHMHLSPRISLSGDLRLGGGHDNDGDQFVSSLISLGGSAYYWFRGHEPHRALQPYARFGVGYLWMPDEQFDDGTDDDDDDWDKSRNYKKNGAPAPGHSDTTFAEAVGLRFVVIPTGGWSEIGASLDVELALYQDMHYGIADSGVMITVGLSMFY